MKAAVENKVLAVIFVAAVITRAAIAILTPLYPETGIIPGYNDEPLHLHYVKHIAEHKSLPVYQPTGIDSVDHPRAEFVQCPLYYIIAAPVYSFFEMVKMGWGLYGVRFLSILFGIAGAFFAAQCASVWLHRKPVKNAVLLAMLLAPNAIVFSSLVTNDSLLISVSALFLLTLMMLRTGNAGVVMQIITGIALAAAVWTKLSGLVLMPLLWFAVDPKDRLKEMWLSRFRVAAAFAVSISPLVIWSLIHYNHIFPGLGTPMQDQYLPEQAVGVAGGAVHHPVMAVKIFMRTAAQPYLELWGTSVEKTTAVLWLTIWGFMFAYGTMRSFTDRWRNLPLFFAIVLMAIAFTLRGFINFQVEFRLFAPVFVSLAYFTAVTTERFKIPVYVQAALWILPMAAFF